MPIKEGCFNRAKRKDRERDEGVGLGCNDLVEGGRNEDGAGLV